ncbi:FAD-dependent oxidoreductase [Asticcacaulis sp. BYS171W]|uniref:D-amino-acid oxidase n=1 Tax=Asticcacaulis aquaticus TaxID=2984212 RepID=A0ABT5HWJ4_9CAUL|nr:FAD-dependent oxidoreductase [Asticcacaulis aquaticus]MDC7684445.1 FAD-dependent oxidoreductase [Asticcacaulis aquaticus]
MTETVAVIGAGVCGLSCALTLARQNYKVTVYDRSGFPGTGASASAAGMLTPMGEAGELPFRFVEAGRDAINVWQDWLQELAPEALIRNGSLYVVTDLQLHLLEAFKSSIAAQTDEWVQLTRSDLRALEPHLPDHFSTALFFPNDAHLVVDRALKALVDTLLKSGCQLIREEASPSQLLEAYNRVIDCRGWTEDSDPELYAVKGEAVRLLPSYEFRISRPVRFHAEEAPFYIVPQDGDTLILGATMREEENPIEGMARADGLRQLMSAGHLFGESLGTGLVVEIMSGVRPTYPHKLPKIKWGCENRLISANGMYRHGYLLSPVVAQSIATSLSTKCVYRPDIFAELQNHF